MATPDKKMEENEGEVETIRNILFGDQVSQIDNRFKSIDSAIEALRVENRNLRKALEAEISLLERQHKETHEKIDDKDAKLRATLSQKETEIKTIISQKEAENNQGHADFMKMLGQMETDIKAAINKLNADLSAELKSDRDLQQDKWKMQLDAQKELAVSMLQSIDQYNQKFA